MTAPEGPGNGEMRDERFELSAAGAARREEMLRVLTAEMGRVQGVRRRVRRGLYGAAVVLIAGGVTVGVMRMRGAGGGEVTPEQVATTESPGQVEGQREAETHARSKRRGIEFAVIETDPRVMEQVGRLEGRGGAEALNDDGLLELLTSLDRPTGLVVTEHGTVRLSAAVTDEALGLGKRAERSKKGSAGM